MSDQGEAAATENIVAGLDTNPFESTFSVLFNLKQLIQSLQEEMQSLTAATTERFEKLEKTVSDIKDAKISRFEQMELDVAELRANKLDRFDKLEASVEELRDNHTKRFEKLGARMELMHTELQAADEDIKKAAASESGQLRSRCDKIDKEQHAHKEWADASANMTAQRHDALRTDVTKMWSFIKQNSMADHALKHFGVEIVSPPIDSNKSNNLGPPSRAGNTSNNLGPG